MRLIKHFQNLHAAMEAHRTQPGLPALARALSCSERNVRILLLKMEARGWLRWEAARGRGHFSNLTMLVSPHDVSLAEISGLLAKGELEKAFASLGDEQRARLKARLYEFLPISRSSKDSSHRIRIPLHRQVEELDPCNVTGGIEASLIFQLFSRLTEFDKRSQHLISGLAHHWESDENGTVWHFWLRPGVRFHDGTELQPDDVRQTFLRLRDRPGPFQNIYRHIGSVDLGWGRKITFHLRFTDFLWPHVLASAHASIVPEKQSKGYANMPIGTGPFRLTRRSEYRLTLSGFEDYYRERALLDEIDLWVIEQPSENAGFDLHFGRRANGGTTDEAVTQLLPGCSYIMCNVNRTFFRTVAQRLAFSDWLSPTVLLEENDGSQRPAFGLLPRWNHRKAMASRRPPIPRGASLTMITMPSDFLQVVSRLIADRLLAAGVELDVVSLPYREFAQGNWLNSADLVLSAEALPDDEDFGCYEWFAAANTFRYWMPRKRQLQLDAQLRAVRAESSSEVRMTRYSNIASELVHEGRLIPISHPVRQVTAESHVAGVHRLSFGSVSFSDLWLSDDALRLNDRHPDPKNFRT